MIEETQDPPEISDSQEEKDDIDYSKILEMAKLFSTIMSNNDDETVNDEVNNEDNQPNFLSMLEMAKLFSNLMSSNPTKENSSLISKNSNIAEPIFFDESIHTQQLKVIKAAIPYLDFSHQKILGILVKSLELKRVLDIYKTEDNSLSATSMRSNPNWKFDMLNSIRPHCTEDKQYVIDMITKIMDIGEIMKKMNNLKSNQPQDIEDVSNKSNRNETLIKTLSPMLNDNQKQMLNMLNTIMENK